MKIVNEKVSYVLEYVDFKGQLVTIVVPTESQMLVEDSKIRKAGFNAKKRRVHTFSATKTVSVPLN